MFKLFYVNWKHKYYNCNYIDYIYEKELSKLI